VVPDTTIYMRAFDEFGSDWNGAMPMGDTSVDAQLSTLDGVPDFLLVDETGGTFRLALDAAGSDWNDPVSLPYAFDTTSMRRLTTINGNPALFWREDSTGQLLFVRASNATGTTWPLVPSLVAPDMRSISNADVITLKNGLPVAFYHSTNDKICMVTAADSNGDNWGAPAEIFVTLGLSLEVRGILADGNPAIFSPYDEPGGSSAIEVEYLRALDQTGSTWPQDPVRLPTVDAWDSSDADAFSATIVNGMPAVAVACWPGYPTGSGNLVAYFEALDEAGNTWANPVYLDEGMGYDECHHVNLCTIGPSQHPAVAYIAPHMGAYDIRFAIRY